MERRRITGTLMALVLALLVAGCGGGGGGGSEVTAASRYAGSWRGNWSDSTGDRGTLSLTVGTDGRFTGAFRSTLASNTGEQVGTTGRIDEQNRFTATWRLEGEDTVTMTGTAALGQDGRLRGNGASVQNGEQIATFAFDLGRL